jgi:glycerophosphoryl diester phosphodiesterase
VILTGDEEAKARLVEGDAPRAVRDSNSFHADDPPADGRWTWYALPWGDAVGWYTALTWDGTGQVPATVSSRLRGLVRAAHRGGRRLRLYEVPERTAAWSAALAAGVDLVSTDRLTEMRAFLAPTPVVAAAAVPQ